MSFMSFDYAMRAADAALQFQQSQGQNIKDTNARGREVGTGNAKRKDDLVRQTIEAEYESKSADIKKEKAQKLAKLADDRKQMAMVTALLVGGGSLLGGMIDGAISALKKDPKEVPESEQMGLNANSASNGYATSFPIADGTGNTEQGAIAGFDQKSGNFSLVGVNTSNGKVNGFVNVSSTDMASHILDATKDNPQYANLRSMIDQGPPPMFKAECFQKNEDGSFELKGGLKEELFGNPATGSHGFFADGAHGTGDESGERMAAGLLAHPTEVSTGYSPSARNIVDMLDNDTIRNGMGMAKGTGESQWFTDWSVYKQGKTENSLEAAGHTIGGLDRFGAGVSEGFQKVLFKPLGNSMGQFMQLAQVAKQYEEEYQQKMVEYDTAKKQAAAAKEKLQKLQTLLAMGSSG
ncbi:MAG: hypothetical protein ACAI44_26905 [Candidatus Sericytochromatia bacterium]